MNHKITLIITISYIIALYFSTVNASNVKYQEKNLCSNIKKRCKGKEDNVGNALSYLSSFNRICLKKQLFLDHMFCLLSPQKRAKHKTFLEASHNPQPKACVLKKTDKYYDMERQTYKQMLLHPQVKCALKSYPRTITTTIGKTAKKASTHTSSTQKKLATKCPISKEHKINTAITFLRKHQPKILQMKSIVKYIFCINSPRHAVKQRSALIGSKGKETVPKHCKLELESEKNVYAEWDKELYDKIRKDLRVQCILYKHGHIKVKDASKFHVNVHFECGKLRREDSCKVDGLEHGCVWLNDLDMNSPTVKLPGPKMSYVSIPLPEMIKQQWATRAVNFKAHSQRLRMEKMGWSRPGMCSCLDTRSKTCVFGK